MSEQVRTQNQQLPTSEKRSSIPWQRQLTAHPSVLELKLKIADYAYWNGESAEGAVREALPFLTKEEKNELFAYHRWLRLHMQTKWMTTVEEANPDLKFENPGKKLLFDSGTRPEAFQKFTNWLLGSDRAETLKKEMEDGDFYEREKEKDGTGIGPESYSFTIGNKGGKGGIFKVYRGIDNFVVRGTVSPEMEALHSTEDMGNELMSMLIRLSDTAPMLDPRAGTKFAVWGDPVHRVGGPYLEISRQMFTARERWHDMEMLKLDIGNLSTQHEQWYELKPDIGNYIGYGEIARAADSGLANSAVLPSSLKERIDAMNAYETEELKMFVNQQMDRHFRTYCREMREMFPDWFGVRDGMAVYFFQKSKKYLSADELALFVAKKPEILYEKFEKMPSFTLAAKSKTPENICDAKPINVSFENKNLKMCELMDYVRNRDFELTGDETETGHASHCRYITVYGDVIAGVNSAISMKKQ